MGGRLGCDSCAMLVVLYKLEGRGVPDSSSSRVTELAWISSLKFQSKLEYWRSML